MKKYIKVLLGFFLMFFALSSVSAKEVTMNDLIAQLSSGKYEDVIPGLGAYQTEKGLQLIMNGETNGLAEFTFDGISVFSHTFIYDTQPGNNMALVATKNVRSYNVLLNAISILSGYSERDTELWLKSVESANYVDDGYELLVQNNADGTITYTFNVNLDIFNLKFNYIEASVPQIEVGNITENSVELKGNVVADDSTEVDVYISNDGENFEYNSTSVVTNNVFATNNEGLVAGAQYYFKAVVAKSNNYSDVISANTLSNVVVEEKEEDKVKNPNTNTFVVPYFIVFVCGITGILLIVLISVRRNISII